MARRWGKQSKLLTRTRGPSLFSRACSSDGQVQTTRPATARPPASSRFLNENINILCGARSMAGAAGHVTAAMAMRSGTSLRTHSPFRCWLQRHLITLQKLVWLRSWRKYNFEFISDTFSTQTAVSDRYTTSSATPNGRNSESDKSHWSNTSSDKTDRCNSRRARI